MRALLSAVVAAGLIACGGEPRTIAVGVSPPWGLPAASESTVSLSDCDTVIVLALDKILTSELFGEDVPSWSGGAAKHMNSVAYGAQRATDAVTTSTAGNAAMASLLTGRHVTEHGVISLRDAGLQTLPESETTLAEGFSEAGWSTIFSSGNPLHARGFSGFSQGFEHYEAPRLAEPSRAAPSVATGALLPLKKAFAEGRSVFAVMSFDDLTARSLRPPSAEIASPYVSAALGPLARERADIETALRTLDANPDQAIEDLSTLLARARGSRASVAWNMALRAAHLSVIDAAVGEVLAAVEAAGRQERALVVVTGLRGTLPPGYRHEAGALFTSDAIKVPLAVRWPGGAMRDKPVDTTLSLLDLAPALAGVGGFELQPTNHRCAELGAGEPGTAASGTAYVADSQRRLLAAVQGEVQLERYVDGQVVAFNRSGEQVQAVGHDSLEAGLASFVESANSIDFSVAVPDEAMRELLSFAWETSPGSGFLKAADGPAAARRPKVRGKFAVEEAPRVLRLSERGTAVRLRIDASPELEEPIGPSLLHFEGVEGSEQPLMFTPLADGEVHEKDDDVPQARLRIERSNGLWWTLTVDASSEDGSTAPPAKVHVSVWPPRDFVDELECVTGGDVTHAAARGQAGHVLIEGVPPFTCRIKKLAKEDFSVACVTNDGPLEPTEMAFRGQRFATPQAFSCVCPPWHPRGSSQPSERPESGGSRVRIQRTWIGPDPREFTPPSVNDLLELVRLVPGE